MRSSSFFTHLAPGLARSLQQWYSRSLSCIGGTLAIVMALHGLTIWRVHMLQRRSVPLVAEVISESNIGASPEALAAEKLQLYRVMQDFFDAIPPAVQLTSCSLQATEIVCDGVTDDPQQLTALLKRCAHAGFKTIVEFTTSAVESQYAFHIKIMRSADNSAFDRGRA
jgi:hypothetical protein